MTQGGLFDELPETPKEPEAEPYDWTCVSCGAKTPYLFKGIRYCAKHHPEPGSHIKS